MCFMKHTEERKSVKRIQVTFTERQWSLIERLRGFMGNEDAEIVRNIVLAWLSEKSILSSTVKEKDLLSGNDREH